YYNLTDEVTVFIAELFKALFPDFYFKYRKAFEAGVWLSEDKGPWLGRAVVYKLQVNVHRDGLDGGPTATFPAGYFKGGIMVFPDLGSKFRYEAGAICISLSADLYHAVERWEPVPCPPELQAKNITPGRTSTVFFFPEKSLKTLEGRPPGWMRNGGCLPSATASSSPKKNYKAIKARKQRKKERIEAEKAEEAAKKVQTRQR
ncbi:hypothetical protein B0H12DRAFT_1270400, partial [Mycena haematopus]